MGQKVHPVGIRLGIVKDHTSVWYADGRNYADYLNADLKVRAYLQDKLKSASVSRIDIARPAQTLSIIHIWALSRSPNPYGVRPTSTVFRVSST